jgi:hypothetical protein
MTKTATYDDAMKAAVAGEYAAIYGYGVIGSHLSGPAKALALQAEVAHRNLRDAVLDALSDPPPPGSEYAMPTPVTDLATAIAAAVAIEDRCAALWRGAVSAASAEQRKQPLDELVNAALRASAFRRLGGATPGTIAFPGQ